MYPKTQGRIPETAGYPDRALKRGKKKMSWVIKRNDAAELLGKTVERAHLSEKLQPGSFPLIRPET